MINDVFFADMCERVLALCRLEPGDVLAVVDEAAILTCNQPVDQLLALFPTVAMRETVEAAMARLAAASELRLTNDAGTDVTYRLGRWEVDGQYGYTDTPGRWDHWPSGGFVYTGGAEDGVDGTVVLAPGDLLFPHKRYVAEPVTFTIEAGP